MPKIKTFARKVRSGFRTAGKTLYGIGSAAVHTLGAGVRFIGHSIDHGIETGVRYGVKEGKKALSRMSQRIVSQATKRQRRGSRSRASSMSEMSFASTRANRSYNLGGNDPEGRDTYKRAASGKRESTKIPYKELVNMIAPPMTLHLTHSSYRTDWSVNQSYVEEFLFMGQTELRDLRSKCRDGGLLRTVPAGEVAYNDNQTRFKYEGGKIKMQLMNTCNMNIFIEFREYKMKKGNFAVGFSTSDSPLNQWYRDQLNNYLTGDGAYAAANYPIDTARLSNWPQVGGTNGPQAITLSTKTASGMINGSEIPCDKRPSRNSPSLHRNYNLVETTRFTLKPGDVGIYETRIHPFFESGYKASAVDADKEIQCYSRIVLMFVQTELTYDATNDNNIAPGPGQLSKIVERTHNLRALPVYKTNIYIDRTDNFPADGASAPQIGQYVSFAETSARVQTNTPADASNYSEG